MQQYLSLALAFIGSKVKNDDIAKIINGVLTVTSGKPLTFRPSVNGQEVEVTIRIPPKTVPAS